MLESIPCEKYLDEENTNLFNSLSKSYKIELYKNLNTNGIEDLSRWQLNMQADTATITYYKDIDSTASFTHELLHINLLQNGFTDTSEFVKNEIQGNQKLELLFLPTVGHIFNVFAHAKMFPKFKEFGYDKSGFTSDFGVKPNIMQVKELVESEFNNKELPNEGINNFLGSFYTIKDNRNEDNDEEFNDLSEYLRNKDPELFNILENSWSDWLKDESNNNQPHILNLSNQLVDWHNKKYEN